MYKTPARHGMTWTDEDYFTLLNLLHAKGTTLRQLCEVLERTRDSVLPKMSRFGFGVDDNGNVVSTGPSTLAAQGTYETILERWQKKKAEKTTLVKGGDEVSGPMSAKFPEMGSLRDMDFDNAEQRVVAALFNKARLQQVLNRPLFADESLRAAVKNSVLRFPVANFTAQELRLASNYRDKFIKDHLGEPYVMTVHKSRGSGIDLSDALNNALLRHQQQRRDLRLPPGEALLDGFFFNATDNTSKEPSMNFDINFNFKVTTTTTYTLNSRSVLCKSDGELLDDLIRKEEAKIEELGKIKAKPKKLVAEIERRQNGIKQLVELLDSREGAKSRS